MARQRPTASTRTKRMLVCRDRGASDAAPPPPTRAEAGALRRSAPLTHVELATLRGMATRPRSHVCIDGGAARPRGCPTSHREAGNGEGALKHADGVAGGGQPGTPLHGSFVSGDAGTVGDGTGEGDVVSAGDGEGR